MSPKKEHIAKLAAKWEQKTITPEEEFELNTWYQEYNDEQINLPVDFALSEVDQEQRIWNAVQERISVKQGTVSLLKKYRFRTVAVAAAIIMIIAVGILFHTQEEVNPKIITANNDVVPGKVGATLVLASGKKIKLSDATKGELAEEAGVLITKSENGELIYEIKEGSGESNKVNTLYTARGETYRVRLPDGSFVWLNAASSLTYTTNLIKDGKRSIALKGEGYFEVTKDEKHPFVVQTDHQEIEVLGTHFNINAYSDEGAVKTTLLEGSVKVKGQEMQRILRPGEQSVNTGSAFTVIRVDTESVIDWKHGDFIFNGEDFKTAMRKIARWYDVEVVYDQGVQSNMEPGGWISRKSKLPAVLELIEAAGNVRLKIEGRRIHVTK